MTNFNHNNRDNRNNSNRGQNHPNHNQGSNHNRRRRFNNKPQNKEQAKNHFIHMTEVNKRSITPSHEQNKPTRNLLKEVEQTINGIINTPQTIEEAVEKLVKLRNSLRQADPESRRQASILPDWEDDIVSFSELLRSEEDDEEEDIFGELGKKEKKKKKDKKEKKEKKEKKKDKKDKKEKKKKKKKDE